MNEAELILNNNNTNNFNIENLYRNDPLTALTSLLDPDRDRIIVTQLYNRVTQIKLNFNRMGQPLLANIIKLIANNRADVINGLKIMSINVSVLGGNRFMHVPSLNIESLLDYLVSYYNIVYENNFSDTYLNRLNGIRLQYDGYEKYIDNILDFFQELARGDFSSSIDFTFNIQGVISYNDLLDIIENEDNTFDNFNDNAILDDDFSLYFNNNYDNETRDLSLAEYLYEREANERNQNIENLENQLEQENQIFNINQTENPEENYLNWLENQVFARREIDNYFEDINNLINYLNNYEREINEERTGSGIGHNGNRRTRRVQQAGGIYQTASTVVSKNNARSQAGSLSHVSSQQQRVPASFRNAVRKLRQQRIEVSRIFRKYGGRILRPKSSIHNKRIQ